MDIRKAAHEMGYYPVARIARANHVTYHTLRDALQGVTYKHVDKHAAPFHGPTRNPRTGCVVRIDTDSTHGWQSRHEGKTKFFSDSRHGDNALAQAKIWLLLQQNIAHPKVPPRRL